jgi:ankyrin repeat protein
LRRDTVVRLARHGDTPALAAWLAAGGDPHFRDPARRTMLHLLAYLPGGRTAAMGGASVGGAAVDVAAEQVEALLLDLLAAGLDLEARDRDGMTPLLFAVAHGGAATTVRALVTMGADVHAVTFSGDGWAELAVAAGRLDELWFLVEP